jgi:crotonobetainyl-CoA:carnitine CoA-transferase CaiB-like acyl-CoA transferase
MAPHGIYPVAGTDRWVSIAAADDAQWQSLVGLMGQPAWAADPDLAHAAKRVARSALIDRQLSLWTASREQCLIVRDLRQAGIACSPVQDMPAQWSDPHFQSRAVRQETVHPVTGPEMLYRTPWSMERSRPEIQGSAPLLGQHNDYVFEQLLGLDPGRVARLKADGVIA